MTMRVLQRVVMPLESDEDILPLYVEGALGQPVVSLDTKGREQVMRSTPAAPQDPAQVLSRRSYQVKASSRSSFGTFFNAFPASYWRRWTVVEQVQLQVTVSGSGTIVVYRSTARGDIYKVDIGRFTGAKKQVMTWDLPLASFADGGWYWFDVVADERGATMDSAQWLAETDREQGTVSIGVTTLNRPKDIVTLLNLFASDDELLAILDRVHIVDQGAKHAEDEDGFELAEKALNGRLHMIRQANLGGSGGFSRGMSETLDEGKSTYHLVSDDDIATETESIIRAVTFADMARRPTLVGGHMFSMYDRAYLHSMGERVNMWRFVWGHAMDSITQKADAQEGHHLGDASLRSTEKLHRRIDVDYNGWWMTLIPTVVLRQLGLSMPYFIKWDDAEYGLRARDAGIPTVTLPGVGVWHVPWSDKGDSFDWQAYYFERNRLVSALLHSPYDHGGRLVRESLYLHMKFMLATQYSVSELGLQAIEDVLSGPEHMHAQIAARLPQIRATQAKYDDARAASEPSAFPITKREKPMKKGPTVHIPEYPVMMWAMAAKGALRAIQPVRPMSRTNPEAEIAAQDARWWVLSQFDSAVVSRSDGAGAAWYKRSPKQFRNQALRSARLHQRLITEWPQLAKAYREAMAHDVSQEAWKETFARANEETAK